MTGHIGSFVAMHCHGRSAIVIDKRSAMISPSIFLTFRPDPSQRDKRTPGQPGITGHRRSSDQPAAPGSARTSIDPLAAFYIKRRQARWHRARPHGTDQRSADRTEVFGLSGARFSSDIGNDDRNGRDDTAVPLRTGSRRPSRNRLLRPTPHGRALCLRVAGHVAAAQSPRFHNGRTLEARMEP